MNCGVFPLDGTSVWPRTAIDGKPAVYVTRNGGRPLGLYFGTTSGELWASRDEGEGWKQITAHLPQIQSVEVA